MPTFIIPYKEISSLYLLYGYNIISLESTIDYLEIGYPFVNKIGLVGV